MQDDAKSRAELISELEALRRQVNGFEAANGQHGQIEGAERLRQLFDDAPVGYHELDTEGRIVRVNHTELEMLGYTAEEMLGRPAWEFVVEREASRRAISDKLKGHAPPGRGFEQTARRKDGTTLPVLNEDRLLRDERGEIIGIRSTMQDITDHKQAEVALRRSESFLESIIEHSPYSMWVSDDEGTMIRLNQACRDLLSITDEEVIGKYNVLRDNIVEEQGLMPLVRSVFDEGKTVRFHLRYDSSRLEHVELAESASVILDVNISPIRDVTGRVTNAVIQHVDITDRERAEAGLRRATREWKDIFQAIGHPTAILDPEHGVIAANRAVVRAAGKTEDELLGKKCYEIFHGPETETPPEGCPLEQMLSSGQLETSEMEMAAFGGVFLVSCTPVLDDEGNLEKVIHIATDITGRKRAEEVIRSLATFPAENPNPVLRIGNDDSVLYANEPARALLARLGCEPDAPVPAEWRKTARNTRERGSVLVLDVSGDDTLFALTFAPVEKADYVTVYGMDITERKRAEVALRESEAKYRGLYDSVRDGIAMADLQGRVLEANPAFLAMLGYTLDELRSRTFYELVPDKWHGMIRDVIDEQVLARGYSDVFEAEWLAKDGTVILVSTRGWLVTDEQGEPFGIWAIIQDITESKRAEEERRHLEAQVQQAQKMESLGVLAGGIAHDFNNLLVGILGNAELALMDLSPASPAREGLEQIEAAAMRAAELARQMLAYSGRGRFVIEKVHLNELVTEMGHLLAVSISKKAVLRYNLADQLPAVEADMTQMRQVVMNLITNASEAVGDAAGTIAISTGAMRCDLEYLSATYLDDELPEGLYVHLEVTDTGCGMDDETLSKIFDPFFTTKFSGRGLGLAAVLGIIRGHKGALKVYSEPGRGTTFKVLLPVVEGSAEMQEAESTETGGWRGSGTILVVDDEETVRTVGGVMLGRVGFSVLTAADGREALRVFREHADDIVCVLLDLTMPDMGGEETFRELRRIRRDVHVILSSGYSEEEVTQRFVGKGLAGFVQKPYQLASLLPMLKRILSG